MYGAVRQNSVQKKLITGFIYYISHYITLNDFVYISTNKKLLEFPFKCPFTFTITVTPYLSKDVFPQILIL